MLRTIIPMLLIVGMFLSLVSHAANQPAARRAGVAGGSVVTSGCTIGVCGWHAIGRTSESD